MTTAITINAHAGWDVEVVLQTLDNEGQVISSSTDIIPKHTEKTVYIHSHLSVGGIREVKPD